MGTTTAIGWTDHTFQPWRGCSHVSPGCENCYAEALGKRTGVAWGDDADRVPMAEGYWRNPAKWNRAAAEAGRPALVFCASLADVFEDRPELVGHRDRLFETIEATSNLRWLLLTKRPQNVLGMVPSKWLETTRLEVGRGRHLEHVPGLKLWPANAWIGTTVEDERRGFERIPSLLAIPAPVRFLSLEPLLEEVRLSRWLFDPHRADGRRRGVGGPIDWLIVGGESGPGHRPFDPKWARILRTEAEAAEVPFFFKQHGGRTPTAGGDLLDGVRYKAWPAEAGDRSGAPVEIGHGR